MPSKMFGRSGCTISRTSCSLFSAHGEYQGLENIKASLAMYFAMIDTRIDDEDETNPRLLYVTSWRFQAPEEVESSSLAMITFTHDIQFCFKIRKNKIFLKLMTAERVKEVEFLDEDLIQVKCMTSGVLIRPENVYHFTLILPSKQIPFTLSHFLESLEPTDYRGEIKHVKAKIDKGEYKERDGSPAVGKRLYTKVNSLLQDFSVIKGKLEAQRAFASPRFVSRKKRPPGVCGYARGLWIRQEPAQRQAKLSPGDHPPLWAGDRPEIAPWHRHQVDNPLVQPPRCLRLLRLALRTP